MIIRSWSEIASYYDRLSKLDFECFRHSSWTCQNIKGLFDNYNLTIILEVKASQLMGFIAYSTIQPEVELLKIGVQSKHRRCSIGSRLFEQMMGDLQKQEPLEKIFLEVRSDNNPAIAFYKTLKFKKHSLRKNYYSNPDAEAVVLVREL